MFFEDAELAAPLLGLVLTARHKDSDVEAPMCGVPHHALDAYVARLVAAGTRLPSPSSPSLPERADPGGAADRPDRHARHGRGSREARREESQRAGRLGANRQQRGARVPRPLDGEFVVQIVENGTLPGELLARRLRGSSSRSRRTEPRSSASSWIWRKRLFERCFLGIAARTPRRRASLRALPHRHARGFGLRPKAPPWTPPPRSSTTRGRRSGRTARTSRASGRNGRGRARRRLDDRGAPRAVPAAARGRQGRDARRDLDRTGTAFGARALRRLLERPLGRRAAIEQRLDAVEELIEDPARLEALARDLRHVPTCRAFSPAFRWELPHRGTWGARLGIERAAALADHLASPRSDLLRGGGDASLAAFPTALGATIARRLVDEPPLSSREGGIFRNGVDAELDGIRTLRRESATILSALEAAERARRGIPNLRVKFNQVFGHVFEVPGSARAKIPDDALKRQTLASVERYATPELVAVDEKLRTADARISEREATLFFELTEEAIAAAPGSSPRACGSGRSTRSPRSRAPRGRWAGHARSSRTIRS